MGDEGVTPEETHLRMEALLMDARNFPTRAHNLRLPWEEGFAGAVLTGAAPRGSPFSALELRQFPWLR